MTTVVTGRVGRACVNRAPPIVTELFRNGVLHQPAPPDQVSKHLKAYRATPRRPDSTNQYNGFYRPNTKPNLVNILNNQPEIKSIDTIINRNEISRSSNVLTRDIGCAEEPLQNKSNFYTIDEEVERRRRRLTVLFTWLGAKEKYAHKYIGLWTQRGNSVLHVTCSITDLLVPRTGAEETAARVRDHISGLDGWRVLVHGLSVGGYITQHVLKTDEESVSNKISHQIYDSFTNVEGLAEGVENAVPSRYSGLAKKVGELYMRYADLSSFNEARKFILEGKANSPVFFMHSMADRVAQYKITEPLVAAMQRKTCVDTFLVPEQMKVPHVALLRFMGPPTYMDTIEAFLDHHPDPVK